MQSRSTLWVGMAVLTATLFGMGHEASAKSIWAMATDQTPNTPSGTTYTGCGTTSPYWAQASGFYADGSLACLARSFANGSFIQSSCLAGATTFRSTVRSTGNTYCSGATNPWAGTISACHAVVFGKSSASSTCGNIDLGVWGRGL